MKLVEHSRADEVVRCSYNAKKKSTTFSSSDINKNFQFTVIGKFAREPIEVETLSCFAD